METQSLFVKSIGNDIHLLKEDVNNLLEKINKIYDSIEPYSNSDDFEYGSIQFETFYTDAMHADHSSE